MSTKGPDRGCRSCEVVSWGGRYMPVREGWDGHLQGLCSRYRYLQVGDFIELPSLGGFRGDHWVCHSEYSAKFIRHLASAGGLQVLFSRPDT